MQKEENEEKNVRVGGGPLDGEVVVLLAGSQVGCSLGDQFGSPEGGVPSGGLVDGELEALGLAGDAGVGVCGRDVEVFGDRAGAVDVVLVLADLCVRVRLECLERETGACTYLVRP